jgi:hypothetical protein
MRRRALYALAGAALKFRAMSTTQRIVSVPLDEAHDELHFRCGGL